MELRVNVDHIKEAGLVLDRSLDEAAVAAILEAEPPTGFHAAAGTDLHVRLDRVNDREIVAKGAFTVRAKADCRRCLEPVEVTVPVSFTVDFVPRDVLESLVKRQEKGSDDDDKGEGEIAGTFGVDEADQVAYTGKELDLAPVVREQLLLSMPMDALCKEDCQGLCQACGTNLNVSDCSCDPHVPDPRWAGLKSIKLS